jgi:hypothetical protein
MKTPTQNALYLRARRVVDAGHSLRFRDGSMLELEDAQYLLAPNKPRPLKRDATPHALYMRDYRKRKAAGEPTLRLWYSPSLDVILVAAERPLESNDFTLTTLARLPKRIPLKKKD